MAGRNGVDTIDLAKTFIPPTNCVWSTRSWIVQYPSQLKMTISRYDRTTKKVFLDVPNSQRYGPRDTPFNLTDGIEYKVCNINFEIYDCGANTYSCVPQK